MATPDKPLVWLAGEVKTPPFSKEARVEAGVFLRCSELRIRDERKNWRIVVRCDSDAVVIAEVFEKKTRTTPARVIAVCKERLGRYDEASRS